MIRTTAVCATVLSLLLVAAAYAAAFLPGGTPPWAPWAMALGTSAIVIALMVLGAVRAEGLGPLVLPFAITFLILFGGFALALALPPETADGQLLVGLPRRAAIILYGIGLLPFFIIPVAYAATFDRHTLSEADLSRLRRVARSAADAPAGTTVP